MRAPFFSTLFEKTKKLALFLKHNSVRQLHYTHALSLIVLERHVLVCKSIFQITGILTKSVTLQQK